MQSVSFCLFISKIPPLNYTLRIIVSSAKETRHFLNHMTSVSNDRDVTPCICIPLFGICSSVSLAFWLDSSALLDLQCMLFTKLFFCFVFSMALIMIVFKLNSRRQGMQPFFVTSARLCCSAK